MSRGLQPTMRRPLNDRHCAILHALNRNGPSLINDIAKHLGLDGFYSSGYTLIYPALRQLEDRELVGRFIPPSGGAHLWYRIEDRQNEPDQEIDMPQATDRERYDIVRLLVMGQDISKVADATGRDKLAVRDIAAEHGWPNRDSMFKAAIVLHHKVDPKPVPAPRAVVQRSSIDDLLDQADRHPMAKISRRAKKIRESLEQLQDDVEAERETAAAQLKVADLEAQLATARDELREARRQSKPATEKRDHQSNAEIRAWAAKNGHQVGKAGRVPAEVVKAYQEAQQEASQPIAS